MARTIMKDAYSPPYLWRLFFTGLSFLFFGLGGLLLTLVGFPLVNLLFRDPLRKRHAVRCLINNASMEMFDDTVAALKEGQTLIIFPEGTRTIPGEMPKFHRGATAIALRGAQVITPVVIRVQPTTLTKAEPWYNIPPRRPNFSFTVGEDINPQDFAVNNSTPIASRKLDAYLHSYYAQELTKNE